MSNILNAEQIEYLSELKKQLTQDQDLVSRKISRLLGEEKELLLRTLVDLLIKINRKEFPLTEKYVIQIISTDDFVLKSSCGPVTGYNINFSELLELTDLDILKTIVSSIYI